MLGLHITAPFGTFRKSFARSYAETYPLPPPSTVYGMILSLVGERRRTRHAGVRLAFAYARVPRITTVIRSSARYKYGVTAKQSRLGNAPEYIQVLCGLDFVCEIDSSNESAGRASLEDRVMEALEFPERVTRTGVLCLGASDDVVTDVALLRKADGLWQRLRPEATGPLDLPVWVDHVGSIGTRWQRYTLAESAAYREPTVGEFVAVGTQAPLR